MTANLLETVVLPIANESDAERTCEAAKQYLEGDHARIVVVHVIEKAGGYIDKAPMEKREEQADQIFEIMTEAFADTPADVETELRYSTDVADAIFEAAADVNATAVLFVPRSASRLVELFGGSETSNLIKNADRPVIVLPSPTD